MSVREPLSRERILETASHLADQNGIESLTMRKLARELGVEAMSLYNHVASKGDLVDAMVDLVVREIELPSSGEAWDVDVRRCAVSAHEALLRHSWACSLAIGPTATRALPTARLAYIEWLLRRLREAGFSPELAYDAYHAIDSHILGFTLWQLGHRAAARDVAGDTDLADFAAALIPRLRDDGFPYLAEHAELHLAAPDDEGAREFEFGLDLVLDGLRRALARAQS